MEPVRRRRSRCWKGYAPRTSGEIRVAGFDPVAEPDKVHRVIGVQLQSTALFDYLNCAEIIALFAALYGADASPARVEHLLALVGLRRSGARAATPSPGAAAAAGHRPGARQYAADRVPRRADDRARPGRPAHPLADDPRHPRRRDDGRPDDTLYGRSRAVVRPHRHHGSRPGRRLRYAARVDPAARRRCDGTRHRATWEHRSATICGAWKAWSPPSCMIATATSPSNCARPTRKRP